MIIALPKNLIESKFDSTNVSAETKLFCRLTDELQVNNYYTNVKTNSVNLFNFLFFLILN